MPVGPKLFPDMRTIQFPYFLSFRSISLHVEAISQMRSLFFEKHEVLRDLCMYAYVLTTRVRKQLAIINPRRFVCDLPRHVGSLSAFRTSAIGRLYIR